MNNNMNQTPNTGNGYPQSQQPYPQSAYSQSQQPYPQSGYPQSQQPYPQSNIPYPMSGYAEKKKSSPMKIIIISLVAVLIVALATTLIVVLQNKEQGIDPPPTLPLIDDRFGTIILISKNGSTINGQPANIDFFEENGKSYLKLEDISSTAGYDFVREDDTVKLLSQLELAIIEVGSTKVTLQDQTTKATSSVEILKAPFEKNGDVYVYSRDLSIFLKNTNVSYNSATDSVEIRISDGMGGGGPGGQPPMGGGPMPQGGQPYMGGQMPQNGQVQYEAQPQQSAPLAQTENNAETEKTGKTATPHQNPPDAQPPQN